MKNLNGIFFIVLGIILIINSVVFMSASWVLILAGVLFIIAGTLSHFIERYMKTNDKNKDHIYVCRGHDHTKLFFTSFFYKWRKIVLNPIKINLNKKNMLTSCSYERVNVDVKEFSVELLETEEAINKMANYLGDFPTVEDRIKARIDAEFYKLIGSKEISELENNEEQISLEFTEIINKEFDGILFVEPIKISKIEDYRKRL